MVALNRPIMWKLGKLAGSPAYIFYHGQNAKLTFTAVEIAYSSCCQMYQQIYLCIYVHLDQ